MLLEVVCMFELLYAKRLACFAYRVAEEANESQKLGDEKPVHEDDTAGVNTENPAKESEEKEPEDKVCVVRFFW